MTPFALLCDLAGLSQREAGEFLKMSLSSVDKMRRGLRSAPPGALGELRHLIEKQERAAGEAYRLILASREADEIQLGYPADDHEAQSLGWPCVGAWKAMAARAMARIEAPFTLVPRGSTPTTAAAIDARERR